VIDLFIYHEDDVCTRCVLVDFTLFAFIFFPHRVLSMFSRTERTKQVVYMLTCDLL